MNKKKHREKTKQTTQHGERENEDDAEKLVRIRCVYDCVVCNRIIDEEEREYCVDIVVNWPVSFGVLRAFFFL